MNNKIKKLSYSLALITVIPILANCNNSSTFDFSKMREAYRENLLENTGKTIYEDVPKEEITSNLTAITLSGEDTYKFNDINYNDDGRTDVWYAATHMIRTVQLCITSERKNDNFYKDIAIKLTKFWVFNDFKSANWWWNDLSGNTDLATTGLFIYDDLSHKAQAAFKSKVHRASLYYNPLVREHTGGNLFNYADLTLKSALVTEDKNELSATVSRMEDEIVLGNSEGFQEDGTFFQHGKQVQTMSSYGTTIVNIGKMLSIIAKGNINFSEEKLKIITNYFLNGVASLIHKGYLNYLGVGREMTRPYILNARYRNKGRNMDKMDYYLECNNLPQREEWNQFLDRYYKNEQIIDNDRLMFFKDGDYGVKVIDGIYFSYKSFLKGMRNSESVNGENRIGLNLSYGSNTAIMENGNEYYDICPLIRFDYLPGTTSYQVDEDITEGEQEEIAKKGENYLLKGDKQFIEIITNQSYYNDGELTGDLSEDYWASNYLSNDGKIAVFTQDGTHHKENKFTVTGILSDDGLINIGSNLSYTGEVTESTDNETKVFTKGSRQLHTTLEQCYYKGSYTQSEDKKSVIHGNVEYKSLDTNTITEPRISKFLERHNRSWIRDNSSPEYITGEDKNHATGETITIAINHGENRNNASYAYIARPSTYKDKEIKLCMINDSKKIHAVELSDGTIVAAFYEAGSFVDSKNITHEGSAHEIKLFHAGVSD